MMFMALIKCSKCGKEISDKALKCIHCGNPLNSKIANNTVFTIPEVKINSNLVILYILSIIFSILLFLYIYELNSIVTLRSGNYTILKLVKWLLIERNNSPILYEAFKIITWVIIMHKEFIGQKRASEMSINNLNNNNISEEQQSMFNSFFYITHSKDEDDNNNHKKL